MFHRNKTPNRDLGNSKIVDIEDNAINGQFSNGQKPERVVFVLLENQHCDVQAPINQANGIPQQQQQQHQNQAGLLMTRQQQVAPEDPCVAAPKVNDPQFDSACYNGGACRPTSNSIYANYSCVCPAGFAGPLCEINVDDCVDHQCQNGAMCVDGINSYKCICRDPTTTGEFCEQMNPTGSSASTSSSSSFAPSSANSIAPLALPIIAAGGASILNGISSASGSRGPSYEQVSTMASSSFTQPQQILARSAEFSRLDDLAATATVPNHAPAQMSKESAIGEPQQDACHRVTQRMYYEDGNGCQSVRVLKISECSGSCGGQGAAGQGVAPGCCLPAKVKRRRIRMQCSDGASYVKTIDLVKKCACSSDSSCQAQDPVTSVLISTPASLPAAMSPSFKLQKTSMSSNNYYKYLAQHPKQPQQIVPQALTATSGRHSDMLHVPFNVSQADQMLQITRLDAVD